VYLSHTHKEELLLTHFGWE